MGMKDLSKFGVDSSIGNTMKDIAEAVKENSLGAITVLGTAAVAVVGLAIKTIGDISKQK